MIQQHKHTKGHHVSKLYQTGKYQLNKIETDDPLSPAPLNENADKLEAAIQAEATARAAGDAALTQRVTVLELKKIITGRYVGDGASERRFNLGITPKAIIFSCYTTNSASMSTNTISFIIPESEYPNASTPKTLELTETGFLTRAGFMNVNDMNKTNSVYHFIALS